MIYRKSSIKLPGGLFISSPFEGGGGLYRDGSLFERGGLFNLEQTMVSVLHKELEYSSTRRLEVMQPRITNKSELPGVDEYTISDQSTWSFIAVID